MNSSGTPDVVVIGSGPNGLTAAAILAGAGMRVLVLEASSGIGGAAYTAETTVPGFRHDPCSAFFPLAQVGPIGELPLERHGLEWLPWGRAYGGATPTGPGVSITVGETEESIASFETAQAGDGAGWRALQNAWEWGGPAFQSLLFNPLGHPAPIAKALPLVREPQRLLEFAQLVGGSARAVVERYLHGEDARVWLSGSVLHSDLAPEDAVGGGFGLLLCGLAQQLGMPIPRGGAQAISDALARLIVERGGVILRGQRVEQVIVRGGRAVAVRTANEEIEVKRAVLATVEPQSLFLDLIDGGHLPPHFVQLVRRFRWGTGVFQMDLALSALPSFRAPALNGTLAFHLGRSMDELTRGVAAARRGVLPEHPLLIAGIHTLADPSRAPEGQHTFWLMTHVPSRILDDAAGTIGTNNWGEAKEAYAARIIQELEEYAPGIRGLVLGQNARTPEDLQATNSNLVGGDIGSGSYTLDQQMVFRPMPGWFRYQTPVKGLYMGGASCHPGGGVHGAAGSNAARVLLNDLRLAPLAEGIQLGARAARRLASGAARAAHRRRG